MATRSVDDLVRAADNLRRLLQVQRDIADVLAAFPPAERFLVELLEIIGRGLDLTYGAVWLPDDADEALERKVTFGDSTIEGTHTVCVRRDEGLVGRVWASGEPQWTVGPPTHLAFPLVLGDLHAGVMEFGSPDVYEPDEDALAVFASSGAQIAQFLDRWNQQQEADRRDRALAAATNGVIITDGRSDETPIVYVNPGFERLTGYSQEEALGRNCRFLQDHDRDQPGRDEIRAAIAEKRPALVTLRNYRKDGSRFWCEIYLSPVRDPDGTVIEWIGVQNDVTDRVEAEEEVTRLAYRDPLTGLGNRTLLSEMLELSLARARRHETAVALLLVDLDNFKEINDTFGHLAGDELLRQVGARLSEGTRDADVVARQGGDEFLVLLTDLRGDAEVIAMQVAAKLAASLTLPYTLRGVEVSASASIGVSVFPSAADGTDALLGQADAAMYRVKRRGGAGFSVHGVALPASER